MTSHIRAEFIADRDELGSTQGRVVTLDDRIVVDEYHPGLKPGWECDNCGTFHPVTAQFKHGDGSDTTAGWVTLCRTCLQNAINGIDYSLAHPLPEGA